jgi:tetratricopeptide (TPR) repeat protein
MAVKPMRILSLPFLLPAILVVVLLQGCTSGPPPTPIELGEAALSQGDWRLAKVHFAEALRTDTRMGRAWLGTARTQLMARDAEGALRSLASLSKVDRALFLGEARVSYGDALEGAARHRLDRKKSESGLAAVRALSKLDPGRRGLSSLLGRALIAEAERRSWQGDRARALALYREACTVVPGTLDAWVGAAEILLEMRRGKEAIKLLALARKHHPTAGSIRTLTIQALSFR